VNKGRPNKGFGPLEKHLERGYVVQECPINQRQRTYPRDNVIQVVFRFDRFTCARLSRSSGECCERAVTRPDAIG
jgi:hypothetical protein